jgi:hypothetical protein
MIDHLNPYLASSLVADRLQETRHPRHRHAAEVRQQRATRRPRRWLVSR